MTLFIKVGSITNAQRGQRVLRSSGYKAQIKKIEKPTKTEGCGYALEVYASDNEPVNILERNRITIRGVEVI